MAEKIDHIDEFVNYLLEQNSFEQLKYALGELLTRNELIDVSNRLQILMLLEKGVPQRQIAEQLGVGIATVTRGSTALKKRNGD